MSDIGAPGTVNWLIAMLLRLEVQGMGNHEVRCGDYTGQPIELLAVDDAPGEQPVVVLL